MPIQDGRMLLALGALARWVNSVHYEERNMREE